MDLLFPVRYKGADCVVTIPREIIDDIARCNPAPAERIKIVEKRLPEFLSAVEARLSQKDDVPLA